MDKCRRILATGLVELGFTAERIKLEQLLAFIELLIKWNKVYNLTAIGDKHAMASLHILDSLTLSPYIRGQQIIDIGTGAGLPGIPLAIYHPEQQFTLIDSNAKKTRFVQQVSLELKLTNVAIFHTRVEDFNPNARFDTLICRAFSKLTNIINLTSHLLTENGLLLAMKGEVPTNELIVLRCSYQLIHLHIPTINVNRCLICIGNIP
jgi:16S rRNA (guanine527-N7)-methyltransferase